jgi:hypothetical protein
MITVKFAYIVLLILSIVVLGIYLFQTSIHRIDRFNNLESSSNMLVNLPSEDIHFLIDDNPMLITTPIINYKLSIFDKKEDTQQVMKYISVFMHSTFQYKNSTYTPLGQYIVISDNPLDISDINSELMKDIRNKKCICYLASSRIFPIDYKLIWTSDINKDGKIFSAWKPLPPPGYISMGDVIIGGIDKPALEYITCLPVNMLDSSFIGISNGLLWHGQNDMGKQCYCWSGGNIDTFRVSNIYNPNMEDLADVYNINQEQLDFYTITNSTVQDKQIVNGILI